MRAGHVVKWPASMAAHQVDKAGEKREAWKKATRLASVVEEVGRMALAWRKEGRGAEGAMSGGEGRRGEGLQGGRVIVHKLVVGER